jgi:uncharacterized protein YjbJ (UPF0337 family)
MVFSGRHVRDIRSFSPSLAAGLQRSRNLSPAEARFVYMKSSTKDKIKGRATQAKGVIKEKVGGATGNREMQDRGTGAKVAGTVRNTVGDVKKVFGK